MVGEPAARGQLVDEQAGEGGGVGWFLDLVDEQLSFSRGEVILEKSLTLIYKIKKDMK